MHDGSVTGRVVPDQDDHLVRVLLLEFKQEGMGHLCIKALDARKVETFTRQRRDSREEIAVIKFVLAVDDGALPHLRPASPEVRNEAISHFVAEEKLEGFLS